MSALAQLFDEYARLNPEPPCWLDFEDGGDGNSHCLRCIKNLDAGRDRYTVGCGAEESDGCIHCGTCGKLLDYTLTESGQASELAHFESVKFRRDKPLDRETAYHIARMLWGNETIETVRVAARAIRCMRSVPRALQPLTPGGEG